VDLDGTAIGDRTLRYRMRVLRRCSAGRETSRDNCLFIAAGPSRSESRRERLKVWKSIGCTTRWPGVTTSTKGIVPDLSRGYAMPNRSALTIGFVLRALFCAMLVLIISLLLLPIDGDLRQRADSAEVARTAHAARLIFEALRNLRLERGPRGRPWKARSRRQSNSYPSSMICGQNPSLRWRPSSRNAG